MLRPEGHGHPCFVDEFQSIYPNPNLTGWPILQTMLHTCNPNDPFMPFAFPSHLPLRKLLCYAGNVMILLSHITYTERAKV